MEGDWSQPESLAGSRCVVRRACGEDSWGGVMRLHLAVGTGPGLLSSPQLLTSEGLIGKAMSLGCECVTETGVEAASTGRGRAGRKAARTRWPRAHHRRGREEGGLASQPPGPQGQEIGIISLGRRRLWDKACISKTLGRATIQAWRVRVTPTSILASLLHFRSKSTLQVAVGKPRRLPVPSRVRTTVLSQGSLGPSGVSAGRSTSFLLWSGSQGGGRWCLRSTQLVPLAYKGTVPKPVYEKFLASVPGQNWCSRVICREKAGGSD